MNIFELIGEGLSNLEVSEVSFKKDKNQKSKVGINLKNKKTKEQISVSLNVSKEGKDE